MLKTVVVLNIIVDFNCETF